MNLPLALAIAGLPWVDIGAPAIPATLNGANAPAASAPAAAIDAILDRWMEVQGGLRALTRLNALDTEEQVDLVPSGQHWDERVLCTSTGQFRCELRKAGDFSEIVASDGRIEWFSHPRLGFGLGTVGPPPSAIRLDYIWTAAGTRQLFHARTLLPDAAFAGRMCRVLALTRSDGGGERWAFDQGSGQLVRIEFAAQPGVVGVIEYSDFCPVGELVLPFLVRQTVGASVTTVHRRKATMNPAISPGSFALSPARLREAKFVQGILRSYLEAVGGEARILGIHSRVTHMLQTDDSGGQSRVTVYLKAPSYILRETDTAGIGRVVEGFDGRVGWSNGDIQGFRTLHGVELQQLLGLANVRQDAYLAAACPLRQYFGIRSVNGRLADAVALATATASAGTWYFDRDDHHLLRVESVWVGDAKSSLPVTIDFSDFRDVDGIKLPFVVAIANPGMHATITVQNVRNNVLLDDSMFKPQHPD